jgi:seryl-tRNA synthetase
MVNKLGNIVHDSVPIDNNEDNNKVIKTWGEIKPMKINSTKGFCHHHEILAMINGYDPKRG